jgi:hypothetical protein
MHGASFLTTNLKKRSLHPVSFHTTEEFLKNEDIKFFPKKFLKNISCHGMGKSL